MDTSFALAHKMTFKLNYSGKEKEVNKRERERSKLTYFGLV